MGVIEPALTEWTSPIVFIPKKEVSLLFFLDNKKLNSSIVQETDPILRMDDCIDSLDEARIFSTLDSNTGYWQVKIDTTYLDKARSLPTTSFIGLQRCCSVYTGAFRF